MNIAFIGIGNVGSTLANNLAKLHHTVTIAARDVSSESVRAALALNSSLRALPPAEAVKGAEVIFLATPYPANPEALKAAGDLTGKILVDCTNPVGPELTHGLHSRTSGAEEVQRLARGAAVVKAFTIYGYENFQNSSYPDSDIKPAMLIAGDDSTAKATVSRLCEELGWRPVDVGPLSSSLHLEHMALLWIKMARVQGRGANFVWAMLERAKDSPSEEASALPGYPANLTPMAQEALKLARAEADRFHHSYVGTEHLLLGLINLGRGVALNVLQKMGLNLEKIRTDIENFVGPGLNRKTSGTLKYTPRTKRVFSLAAKEAKALKHPYVGTEHILLGLLQEEDGVAARVLQNLGVTVERTRQEVLKQLNPNSDQGQNSSCS